MTLRQIQAIQTWSSERQISFSEMVRRIIDKYIDEKEKDPKTAS